MREEKIPKKMLQTKMSKRKTKTRYMHQIRQDIEMRGGKKYKTAGGGRIEIPL